MDWFNRLTSGQQIIGGDSEYVKQFNRAIETARLSPEGKALIDAWERSEHRPDVWDGLRTELFPDKLRLSWKPDTAPNVYDKDGNIITISPVSALLHEVAHLLDPNLKKNSKKTLPWERKCFQ